MRPLETGFPGKLSKSSPQIYDNVASALSGKVAYESRL